MKRFFITLCTLVLTFSVCADIKYDTSSRRFHSLPKASNINKEEYDDLFMQITERMHQLRGNESNTNAIIEKEITSYLKALNSPTSLRLLQDITKDGFYTTILVLSVGVIDWELWEKCLRHAYSDTFSIKEDLDEFVSIAYQVNLITITCWNNGIYGKKVYDQIISYLISLEKTGVWLCFWVYLHNGVL